MLSFAAFRRWVRVALVRRALLPVAAATAVTIVGVGSFAEEQNVSDEPRTTAKEATPAETKITPNNPLTTLFTTLLGGGESASNASAAATNEPSTHTRQTEFFVKGHDDKGWLQAFAVDSQGRLLAAVGSRATYGVGVSNVPAATREVQVFNAEGKPLEHWSLDFDPQRIAVGPKDEIYVAGSGKIAKFNKDGKLITQIDSPHLEAVLGDAETLRESAEKQREQTVASYQEVIKSFEQQKATLEKRIAAMEEKAEKAAEESKKAEEEKNAAEGKSESDKPAADEPTPKKKPAAKKSDKPAAKLSSDDEEVKSEDAPAAKPRVVVRIAADRATPQLTALKRQLTQNEAQIKSYKQFLEQQENRSVEDIIQEIKQRLQKINAIAVSDEDIFITTGIAKGYGFAVWRTDLEFKNAKQIVANLTGCCGQMDVQTIDGELFIAENTRHRVGRYDRDGKSLTTFGSRERESTGACFGGCCNPMNVCRGPDGTVLTAESEGFVKCFQADGTYVGLIGKAQVAGGCKNVSIATSPDGNRVYFYDLEKSRVVVMAREKPTDEAKPEKTALKD